MKLINLIRQEEAFRKSRNQPPLVAGTTSSSSSSVGASSKGKKRSYEEISNFDAGIQDDSDIPTYIDKILADEEVLGSSFLDNRMLGESENKAKRPEHWRAIAEHYNSYGATSTIEHYPEVCIDKSGHRCKSGTVEMRLRRWKDDLATEQHTNTQTIINVGGRKVPYGDEIDNRLIEQVHSRMERNEPIDCDTLRDLLMVELEKEGKLGMLKENGGEYIFTKSWAQRFFMRHKLPIKLMTQRARTLPIDFDAKVTEFEHSLSLAVDTYKIPPQLVATMQETVLNFVPSAAKNRLKRETPKCKMIGIVKNKAQVTATLCVTESGDILAPQLIFAGNTDRCHPTSAPPAEGYYTHSLNQHQTVDTMIEYVDKILIPYKQYMINKFKMNTKQYMVVKLSFIPAHTDMVVLNHMRQNHIIPVFIPNQCLEIMGEVEISCVKLFKSEVKLAFRDHIHQEFVRFVNSGQPPSEFVVDVKMSTIKFFLSDFVSRGYQALATAEMKNNIKQTFAEQGRMTVCRTKERADAARAARAGLMPTTTVSGGDGSEFYDSMVILPYITANTSANAAATFSGGQYFPPTSSSSEGGGAHHQQQHEHGQEQLHDQRHQQLASSLLIDEIHSDSEDEE